VYENDDMVVMCPYASKAPFEMVVVPRHHAAQFYDATPGDLLQCADALGVALARLREVVGDPDYNMFLATTPVHMEGVVDPQAYRWHFRVIPRIPIAAGFELATAVYVNPTDPDECAQQLRA
jgi:UDPglucose--hexose-1-phosphate uridylyltransferase